MKINILYQSSSSYAVPAAVSICSLLENNKDFDEIGIWFIDVGLTEKDRNCLKNLVDRYERTIVFVSDRAVNQMLSEAGVELWNGSYAAFYKIFIWNQLKEIDSILYIDADTLVLNSLSELCNYGIDNYACAMAASAMTGSIKDFLGLKDYYNTGVIYFNLKFWKKNNLEHDFLEIVRKDSCSKYTIVGDESLINYVLQGKIKKLPLQYNFESSWWLWGWNQKLYKKLGWKSVEDCYYSKKEIQQAAAGTCIAHYVDLTTGRPWDYLNDNLFRRAFEQYCAVLKPWKEIDFAMRGIGGNNKIAAWLKCFVKKMLPFSLRSRLGFYQHDRTWRKKIHEVKKAGYSK